MNPDSMQQTVGSQVVMIDICIYFLITVVLVLILDAYAAKRLGGKQAWGYRVLRMRRFGTLLTCSLFSVAVVALTWFEVVTVTLKVETFFGIPYFAMWFFYLASVLRRVRSEIKGRRL